MVRRRGFSSAARQCSLVGTNHPSSLSRRKRLLKVGNDIVNVLGTDRDADAIFRNARRKTLLLGQLLMGRSPRVDGKSLGVADAGQNRLADDPWWIHGRVLTWPGWRSA